MSASSGTFDRLGWTHEDVALHMDALPLLDEPVMAEPGSRSVNRLHWISAAIALTLFVLARLDLLPAMPW
jgi:hypothetical protein